MISPDSIEEVRERASLIELASEVTNLKKRGSNFVGLCPFHSEKTPSFFIRADGDLYHCFGCGESGNVITFVMKTKGYSFPEAVEELAGRFGVKLRYIRRGSEEGGIRSRRSKLIEINNAAQQYFTDQLNKAPREVLDYLEERDIDEDMIRLYGIGYAPLKWDGLYCYLRARFPSWDEALFRESGLVNVGSGSQRLYDRFRGRLMFPILLKEGKVVGFAGRTIPTINCDDPSSSAKYINTPETIVYKKSRLFFGFPQALGEINRTKEVYVVEGYTDVISMRKAGFENVVAVCGTALTSYHAERLSKFADKVYLMFDGDTAGGVAGKRSFESTIGCNADFFCVVFNAGDDPDTLARKLDYKKDDILANIRTVSLFDYYLDQLILEYMGSSRELGSVAKGEIAKKVVTQIGKVKNVITRDDYVNRLCLRLGVDRQNLNRLLHNRKKKEYTPDDPMGAVREKIDKIEVDLLLALFFHPNKAKIVLKDGFVCRRLTSHALSFLTSLEEELRAGAERAQACKAELIYNLLEGAYDRETAIELVNMWRNIKKTGEIPVFDEVYREACRRWQKELIKQQVSDIYGEMKVAQDEGLKLELAQKKLELERRLASI